VEEIRNLEGGSGKKRHKSEWVYRIQGQSPRILLRITLDRGLNWTTTIVWNLEASLLIVDHRINDTAIIHHQIYPPADKIIDDHDQIDSPLKLDSLLF
jgi:hypothetical protein